MRRGIIRSVPAELLTATMSYVGFGVRDIAQLREMAHLIRREIPRIVTRFYDAITAHPAARAVFAGGAPQIERQKGFLAAWLDSLFCGEYGLEYAEQRFRIGMVHVRVGLPQHLMFTAMEVIWQECQAIVHAADPPEMKAKLAALHKLLTIDTALMLESYKQHYSQRVRDLEHQAMSERLARTEHLAEIGQLAASLAHELKNPLAGISGAVQIIRDDLHGEDPHRPVLDEVLRQINRLDNTVKDLLTYARPKAPVIAPCRIELVLERVTALLRREPAFKRVRLDVSSDPEIDLCADEHQLEQVLVNLLLNAAQASDPGGCVRLRAVHDGEQVLICVEDDGSGMEPETIRRAFEPFFTTKARGTGLGLPICHRIISAHGGSLDIHSQTGAGTRVEVRMPRRERAAREDQP